MTRDKCGFCFQWFGNLVTMEWWNDLWLNEGFAKFMEFVSLDITYPELQVVRTFLYLLSLFLKQPTCRTSKMLSSPQDDFFLGKCFEAMEVDSLSSSHPVSTPVENPTQIQEMFDDVSYDKVRLALSECGLDALKASGSIQWNVLTCLLGGVHSEHAAWLPHSWGLWDRNHPIPEALQLSKHCQQPPLGEPD